MKTRAGSTPLIDECRTQDQETVQISLPEQKTPPNRYESNTNDSMEIQRSRLKTSRKRKRRRTSSNSTTTDDEIAVFNMDERLQQCAIRNNLTHENVKNILTKVVRNDHVLAIVKLKEEEMIKDEQTRKMLLYHNDAEDLTLTRAKAKALNKQLLPLKPFTPVQTDSEVIALIGGELRSDDEDEEYVPGEDDIESDDDPNSTISDIDSQPRTPQTPMSTTDNDDDFDKLQYTKDGLFKIPMPRKDGHKHIEEENLSQRTRSKISLVATPIEAIECTLKAPDVTSDMYEHASPDDDWVKFLTEFQMPMSVLESDPNVEIEEDADPDYVAHEMSLSRIDKYDLEENIEEQELNDLYDELLNNLEGVNLTLIQTPSSSLTTPTNEIEHGPTDNQQLKLPPKSPSPRLISQKKVSPNQKAKPLLNNVNTNDHTILTGAVSPIENVNPRDATYSMQNVYRISNAFTAVKEQIVLVSYNVLQGSPNEATILPSGLFSVPPVFLTVPTVPVSTPIRSKDTLHSSAIQLSSDLIEPLAMSTPKQPKPLKRPKRPLYTAADYDDLEQLDPSAICPTTFPPNAIGFTPTQKAIFDQQCRMHVQLSSQGFLQVFAHPNFYNRQQIFKNYLTEMKHLIENSRTGVFNIINIDWALDLISEWEKELFIDSKENDDLVMFVKNEMENLHTARTIHKKFYRMKFPDRIMLKICDSKVFMYPALLPLVPFHNEQFKVKRFIESEEQYIVAALDYYNRELPRRRLALKQSRTISLTDVCKQISADINYIRTGTAIYDHIRHRHKSMRNEKRNPIKYYYKHKRAPPFQHNIQYFNESDVLPPTKQMLKDLPGCWRNFVQHLIENQRHPSEAQISSQQTPEPLPPTIEYSDYNRIPVNDNIYISLPVNINLISELDANKSIGNRKRETDCLNNSHNKNPSFTQYEQSNYSTSSSSALERGQTLITSFFKAQAISFDKDTDDESILKEESVRKQDFSKAILTWHKDRIVQKYLHHSSVVQDKNNSLIRKLEQYQAALSLKYQHLWILLQKRIDIYYLDICFRIFNIYTCELMAANGVTMKKTTRSNSIEAITAARAVQKLQTTSDTADGSTATGVASNEHVTRRFIRGNKTADGVRLMFLPESKEEILEKDSLFAQQYMDKVKETLLEDNEYQKYGSFISVLKGFNERTNSVGDLYLKLEEIFQPKYSDLAFCFLIFLHPNDALQIGKFMEYYLAKNMYTFNNKQQIFYNKQPAQLRKIHNCLRDLAKDSNVSISQIKAKLFPLMKYNQLLKNWFMECIDNMPVEESTTTDYETLTFRKQSDTIDDNADMYEHIPQSEIHPDPIENPCSLRYMNGGIYYGNRTFSPAKLSFTLATDDCNVDDEASDRKYGKRDENLMNEAKELGCSPSKYRCIHDIKYFGDARLRENKSESIDEGDDSDEDVVTAEADEFSNADKNKADINCIQESPLPPPPSIYSTSLCSDIQLKAHGIRLNPSAHSSLVLNNTDMLNMLKPSYGAVERMMETTDKDVKLSPKKQVSSKLPAPNQLKIQRKLSPNKKFPILNRSPINKKTSPSSNGSSSVTNNILSNSPAILTAKKLKRYVDSTDNMLLEEETGTSDTGLKRPISRMRRISKQYRQKDKQIQSVDDLNEPVCDEVLGETHTDSKVVGDETDSKNIVEACEPKAPIVWTRDEDRLLLEEIKSQLNSSTDIVERISHRFPERSPEDVEGRIEFLVDFLNQLQK